MFLFITITLSIILDILLFDHVSVLTRNTTYIRQRQGNVWVCKKAWGKRPGRGNVLHRCIHTLAESHDRSEFLEL